MLRKVIEETLFGGRSYKTFSLDVTEVFDGEDVHLPVAGMRTLYRDGSPVSVYTFKVKNLHVNSDIPDDFFSFDVPPGTRVMDWFKGEVSVKEAELDQEPGNDTGAANQ